MKLNCCANCEHRKSVGYYAYDACFAQEIKDMFEGYGGVLDNLITGKRIAVLQ